MRAHGIVQLVGEHAGGVHHRARRVPRACRGGQQIARGRGRARGQALDGHDALVEAERRAVQRRLLCRVQGNLVRVANGARLGQQAAAHVRARMRFERAHFGGVQLAHAFHAVLRRARHEAPYAGQLLIGEREHERAVADVGESQLVGPLRKQLGPGRVEASLERSRQRVVAGMHDASAVVAPATPAPTIATSMLCRGSVSMSFSLLFNPVERKSGYTNGQARYRYFHEATKGIT